MKKYNLEKIMKRAWEIKKEDSRNIFGICLKMAWNEARKEENIIVKEETTTNTLIETLIRNIEKMAYSDYHIHAGSDRKVFSKVWEKDGKKRTYLSINCYTWSGNFKGSYKCGYVDMITSQYVVGKYDDVNAETMEYIGR